MNFKRKLVISLIVAVAVLLISIVAIVAVSAAVSQQVKSKIKVTYKKDPGVAGFVSATYSYGDIRHYMTTNGEEQNDKNDHIHFSASESSKTKTLQLQSSDLKNGMLCFSDEIRELTIAFNFVNNGRYLYTASLDISNILKKENITITYSSDNKKWESVSSDVVVAAPPRVGYTSSSIYYVKLSIENPSFNAEFEGSFLWNLEVEYV